MPPSAQSELKVLKSGDLRVNEEDWPVFLLTDAEVYNAEGAQELANLLYIDCDGPFTLEGKLRGPEDEEDFDKVVDDDGIGRRIQISIVRNISTGHDEEKNPIVWALGLCGWYKITPSKKYKKIYDEMLFCVDLWWNLLDLFDNDKPKKWKIDSIAKNVRKRSKMQPGLQTVEEIFYTRRKFLFVFMRKRSNDVRWSQTTFFHHLQKKFLADYRAVCRGAKRVDKADAKGVLIVSSSEESEVSDDDDNDASDDGDIGAQAICTFLENVTKDGPPPRKVTLSACAGKLFEHFDIADPDMAEALIMCRKDAIKSHMANSPQTTFWLKTRIFKEIQEQPSPPNAIELRAFVLHAKDSSASDVSDSEGQSSEAELEEAIMPQEDVLEQDNILANLDDSMAIDDDPVPSDSPSETLDEMPRIGRKGISRLRPHEVAVRLHEPEVIADSEEETELPASKRLRLDPPSKTLKAAVQATVKEEISTRASRVQMQIPAIRPNRPGGVWRCPVYGCQWTIYGANRAVNKDRILVHRKSHGNLVERELLVASEGLGKNTSYLMRQIQAVAKKAPDGSEQVAPRRISKRL